MARILILDNRDSFTFNIAQVLCELLGERATVVWRADQVTAREVLASSPAAIVIGPGPGTPDRAGCSEAVVREVPSHIPLLGVCLGHQAIATAFGGRIVRSRELVHGSTRAIEHDGRGIFRGLDSPVAMTRYNSLTVEPSSVPSELQVTARGPRDEVMALRHRSRPIEGVQFHPESILCLDTGGRKLLANFTSSIRGVRRPRGIV